MSTITWETTETINIELKEFFLKLNNRLNLLQKNHDVQAMAFAGKESFKLAAKMSISIGALTAFGLFGLGQAALISSLAFSGFCATKKTISYLKAKGGFKQALSELNINRYHALGATAGFGTSLFLREGGIVGGLLVAKSIEAFCNRKISQLQAENVSLNPQKLQFYQRLKSLKTGFIAGLLAGGAGILAQNASEVSAETPVPQKKVCVNVETTQGSNCACGSEWDKNFFGTVDQNKGAFSAYQDVVKPQPKITWINRTDNSALNSPDLNIIHHIVKQVWGSSLEILHPGQILHIPKIIEINPGPCTALNLSLDSPPQTPTTTPIPQFETTPIPTTIKPATDTQTPSSFPDFSLLCLIHICGFYLSSALLIVLGLRFKPLGRVIGQILSKIK